MQLFNSDAEIDADVNQWLRFQAANFFKVEIKKLVSRYDKRFNLNTDYFKT